jgi:predicted TIM-barrel fold metal-dependent hydrolase
MPLCEKQSAGEIEGKHCIMQINCHAHLFNLRVLNTKRTRETLLNRLSNEKWPDYLSKILLKVFDEVLKDDHLDETKLLKKLVGSLRLNTQFKNLIDASFDFIPMEVGLVLHGNLDTIAVDVLRGALRKLSDRLSQNDDIGKGDLDDVLDFLLIGLQPTMEDVARIYFDQVPEDSLAVALMMDITKDGKDDKKKFSEQMIQTSNLVIAYPGRVLPFFAVNPLRANHLDLLKESVERRGYVGVKLYPSLGYDLTSETMNHVFQYCEEMDLPILLHCNQGGFFFKKTDINFANPSHWRKILGQYPALRVCFGHFGGDDELVQKTGESQIGGWTGEILRMMQDFPGVYADVSYHVEAMKDDEGRTRYFSNLVELLEEEVIKTRILWGSDFPLVRFRAREGNYWQYFRNYLSSKHFKQIAETNPQKFLGMPSSTGTKPGQNVVRHLEFLAANKHSVKRLPEEWVDRTFRKSLNREVDFFVNPFGRSWTKENKAHIYTIKALLVSRFPKKDWGISFLDFGRKLIRDIPNWPLEVESDKNRADTFSKFAIELDGTLRAAKKKGGPGAEYEQGVHRDDAIAAIEGKFKKADGKLHEFGELIDGLYLFPEERQMG